MMTIGEGGLRPIPPRNIDGVSQDTQKQGPYEPRGILSHEYFSPDFVLITEYGNDLSYASDYWAIDKIWQLYIRNRDIYERLRDKLLQQRVVVVDYTNMNNLGIYIPKHTYVNGIEELFKTVLDELRAMDKESLERHLAGLDYMKIDDTIEKYHQSKGMGM
jgi:hypothetical protein